jgi:RNA polymerase sigma-70 factor (ECF subfamily)
MSDDLATIRRVLDGELDAFRVLVLKYERPLYRFVLGLVADSHEAEDVAQDVFLAAYRALSSYDAPRSGFMTWLLGIARNHCLNDQKRHRPAPLDPLPESTRGRSPESVLAEAEWFRLLDLALNTLPFEQKTVFVLAEIEGMSLAEIASIEGVPIGTIKSRLSHASEVRR